MSSTLEARIEPARTATRRIAEFVANAGVDPGSREQAARVLVDTLAVTLAGGVEPPVRMLEASLTANTQPRSVGSFWTRNSYRSDDAALLIGMASHILDYDDVSMLAVVHPSAPMVSAIVASASDDLSGADVLDAVAVGTEVMIRLGQVMGFRHYALGFHATSTLGTIGAAAACARMARLDVETTANAISIAASYASGLRKNFGSMVKSFHVGMAAANGMRSVRLAAAGIVGSPEPIEADGFLLAFSGAETNNWPDDVVLGEPFAINDPGFEQKRYPCCYMLHRIIEASLALRREHGVTLDKVRSVRVDMALGATKPLIHPFPKSGLNALFSAPYAVCAALGDGRVDLQSFTDENVMRQSVQDRLRDVTVVESEEQAAGAKDIGSAPVTVTATLADGTQVSKTIVDNPGSRNDPLTDADLSAKWLDCLRRVRPEIDEAHGATLLREGLAIEHAQFAPWVAALRKAMVSA
ncbi:2-methylcitrate dehydratase PrpD [Mesorhizobium sp. J18]|uniref:MmgE/PrpD family protein n=1 Tax=Mesorhizobium sp. J18 TaxID=935263 RepID=UPI001199DD6A|nr:MmgE/PrpD family protein [Mesorhizobium sp. J18]TWG96384.1 2-methylcitrate dehydratase PrpD [Mesorhizobium sp. J18]